MDLSIYEFLQLDLMEQNKVIMDLKYRRNELGGIYFNMDMELPDSFHKLVRKIQLFEELQDLQLQDAIYYDEWRDKWIIKEELS